MTHVAGAGATIKATFSTRRRSDLAVEQLVQELRIERTNIFVVPEGPKNSAGSEASGADIESGHPRVDPAGDPALAGGLAVSIDLVDDTRLLEVRAVLEEHGGHNVATE
jgi:hypothetical protein